MTRVQQNIMQECLVIVRDLIRDIGVCEHDVNICTCGLQRLAKQIQHELIWDAKHKVQRLADQI